VIAVPAVDLREGACVQLVGGSYQAERVRLPDPVAVALKWRSIGFRELHVVDLDAATGRGDNGAAVAAILAATNGPDPMAVQVGGGMSHLERIDAVLAAGANRVIVGSRAIQDADWLADVATKRPGRIVVAADVRGHEVVTKGWMEASGRDVVDFLRAIDSLPLAGVLVTAVHVEGRLAGPDLDLVREIVSVTRHPVQASGGIRDLADLRAVAAAGAARAVVGMALYTGLLDPEAAALEFGR
jgi:phosphoribosylformimino-5-aminoimidazole carboxamide ribotide isomerase